MANETAAARPPWAAETEDPPPGIKVRWEHERLDVVLALSLAAQLGLGLGWLAVTALLWTDRLAPQVLGFRLTADFSWPLFVMAWLVLTTFAGLVLRWRTEVAVTRRELTAVTLPWHLPLAVRVPVPQIRDAEIETHRHVDRYGNEHFSFDVLIARLDSTDHPVLLRTTDEQKAVYLRRLLHCYFEDARAARGP